jgi:hypothetical protein
MWKGTPFIIIIIIIIFFFFLHLFIRAIRVIRGSLLRFFDHG